MESIAAPPACTAPTDGLAELVEREGPFLTVVVDTDPAVEDASHHAQLGWRSQREAVAALGAPERALRGIDGLVVDADRHGPALFVVADASGVCFAESLTHLPPTGATARFGCLPALVPLLEDRQARLADGGVPDDRPGVDDLAVEGAAETQRCARCRARRRAPRARRTGC